VNGRDSLFSDITVDRRSNRANSVLVSRKIMNNEALYSDKERRSLTNAVDIKKKM